MPGKPNEEMFDSIDEKEELFDDDEVEKMIGEKYPKEDEKAINGKKTQ